MSSWWKLLAGLAIGGGAYLVLRDQVPAPGEIWATVLQADPVLLVVAGLLQVMAMATFARLLRRLLGLSGVRMSFPRALAVTYARNAVANSLPAGPVLSIAYTSGEFAKLGARSPQIAATLAFTALYSGMGFAALSVVALLGLPGIRLPALAVVVALLVAVAVVSARTAKATATATATGKATATAKITAKVAALVRHRLPGAAALLDAARAAIRPARRDRVILGWLALVNWLLDLACLAMVCVALGIEIGPHTILLGYVAAKTAQALALVPGGLGIAEIGMAATFVAAGVTGGAAAAAVALYRLISYWAILVAGWLAWVLLHDRVWPRARAAALATGRALIRMGAAASPLMIPPTGGSAHP